MKPPALQSTYTDQWKVGMDTRSGIFRGLSDDKFATFRELVNCIVTVDGTLKTRPPLLDVGGTFASNTQGLLYNKGAFYTFGERGSTATHTGAVASTVTTLYFDTPDDTYGYAGAYGQWTLLNYGVYQGYAYALIKHGRNSVASPFVTRLHIWDSRPNEPTYVFDPACPTDWSLGAYPGWVYGTGTGIPGTQKDYNPVSEYAAEKLWVSRADGNVAFSAIGRARIWNSRSVADIEQNGTMYYTRATTGGAYAITVPELFADLSNLDTKYSGYTTEFLDTINGNIWTTLSATYTSVTPAWSSVAYTRVTGTATYPAGDGSLVRVRFLAKPQATVVSGCILDPGGVTFTGDGRKFQFKTTIPYSAVKYVPGFSSGFNLTVNGVTQRRSTTSVVGQYDIIDSNGFAQINFNYVSQTVTVANPVASVQTTMSYGDAILTDTPALLYINGGIVTAGYTYFNNAGKVRVDFAPAININGSALTLVLTPVNTSTVNYDGSGVLVSQGTITSETTTMPTPALNKLTLTALTPSTTYYVWVYGTYGSTTGGISYGTTISATQRTYSRIIATFLTDSAGGLLSYAAYVSPDLAQTDWYVARHQKNLDYFSGENEAAFINSGTHDNSGVPVSTMIAVKNRMMICYPRRTQLWQTSADLNSLAYIDAYDFGTTDPTTVFYNRPVINTQRGVRGFDLTGLNFQSLEDTNIGEAIQFLGTLSFVSVAFWPWTGMYVAIGTLNNPLDYANSAKLDADSPFRTASPLFGMFILSFSKESGTMAWSFNIVPGLTQSDLKQMIPINGKLYTRSGTKMYYLDAESGTYVDAPQSTPISSRAVTHYNHLSAPNKYKRMISLTGSFAGKVSCQMNTVPFLNAAQVEWGPTFSNSQYGQNRVPFTGTATAVGLTFTANTSAGFELQNLQLEYVQAGRS